MATLSIANPNRNGTGPLQTVITGSQNGTVINSLKVVALGPTTTGMIRFFVGKPNPSIISLYAEVPIPTYATGGGILSVFDATLTSELVLANGVTLYASTQNSERFNIFAECYDKKYPATLPNTCCNYIQESANVGVGTVSIANTNLDGSGAIVPIFTADPSQNGACISWIMINALQNTSEGVIRFFLSANNGATYNLIQEVWIPATNTSGTTGSYRIALQDPIESIQAGYILAASTYNPESFAITIEGMDWKYPIQ